MINLSERLTYLNLSKESLIKDIDIILSYFKNSSVGMGETIYKKYLTLKLMLENDELNYNPINGSVRAYLDAFSDWDNPILSIMGSVENNINFLLTGSVQ